MSKKFEINSIKRIHYIVTYSILVNRTNSYV